MRLWARAKGDQRAADLSPRGIAVRVEDARQRVSAFAGAEQFAGLLIKARAPLDQLRHAHRALGHQSLGGGAINDAIAGIYGVFQMERDVLVALHGDGDSALRVVGVGLAERLLGDHQNLAVGGPVRLAARRPATPAPITRKSTSDGNAITFEANTSRAEVGFRLSVWHLNHEFAVDADSWFLRYWGAANSQCTGVEENLLPAPPEHGVIASGQHDPC
jgi:hypothetical protein